MQHTMLNKVHRRAANLSAGLFFAILALFCLGGCTRSTNSIQEPQYASGKASYEAYCASCHEIENGIGPLLKKEVLATRVTAQSLFNYNRRNMPYEAGNTLDEQIYWDVTAYLLMRSGFMQETERLTIENAAALSLTLDS